MTHENIWLNNAIAFGSLADTLERLALEQDNPDRRAKMLDDARWYRERGEMHRASAETEEDEEE